MDNLKKIIDKIKSEKIAPIPRWHFLLKNGMVWTAFVLAVVLGALAFSIVLFAIQQTDFNLISHMSHSKLEFFLGLLPFFWILSLVVFLVVAIYSIQYSKRGYKFTISRLVGISSALSILLGTLFFIGGGAGKLENAFAIKMGLYESLNEKKINIWMNPEEGLLCGTITSIEENVLYMEDFDNNTWEIHYKEAFIAPSVLFEQNVKIKLTGKVTGQEKFQAEEIRPWGGPGNKMRRKGRQ
jgi:hypothetical protein